MTPKQKEELKARFFKASVSDTSGNTVVPVVDSRVNCNLSVAAAQSQIIDVPFPILQPMFQKASRTVENKNNIWKVPSVKDGKHPAIVTFMVVSQLKTKPHTVSILKPIKWSVTVLVQILPGIVFAPIVLLLQRWLVAYKDIFRGSEKTESRETSLLQLISICLLVQGKRSPEPPNDARVLQIKKVIRV